MAYPRAGEDARNVLFGAALEFGPNWRRDVQSLAVERLPSSDTRERAALAEEIERTRNAIEAWISHRWNAIGGNWSEADAGAARTYIHASYPWMNEPNVSHAISQGTYYAWRG